MHGLNRNWFGYYLPQWCCLLSLAKAIALHLPTASSRKSIRILIASLISASHATRWQAQHSLLVLNPHPRQRPCTGFLFSSVTLSWEPRYFLFLWLNWQSLHHRMQRLSDDLLVCLLTVEEAFVAKQKLLLPHCEALKTEKRKYML